MPTRHPLAQLPGNWVLACWQQIQSSVEFIPIDNKAVTFWLTDDKREMLPIAISQVFVITDKTVGRLQGQNGPALSQYVDAMDQLAAFDTRNNPGTRACRHNGGHIVAQRVDDAKALLRAQVLGNRQFVAQQAQLASAAAKQEHTWMRRLADMG